MADVREIKKKVEFREATDADLDAVLDIYGQGDLDDGRRLDGHRARSVLARFRSYPDYRLYVALLEGRVVGAFSLLIMDNLGHAGTPAAIMEDVGVHADFRRHGVGRRMVEYAIERARERGCYKLSLSSNNQRQAAHRFYDALGFQRHGVTFAVYVTRDS
jgi:ribosomal protein S18 acetylase RimI-like enzyme